MLALAAAGQPAPASVNVEAVKDIKLRAEASYVAAQRQLELVTAERDRAVADFKSEIGSYSAGASDLSSEEVTAQLQHWKERIARCDESVRAAEELVERCKTSADRIREVYQLQQQSEQAALAATREHENIRHMRQQYTSKLLHAQRSAEAAAAARAGIGDEFDAQHVPEELREIMQTLKREDVMAAANSQPMLLSASKWLEVAAGATSKLPFEEQLATIGVREVTGPSGRLYGGQFLCMRVYHRPRRWAILLVEWGPFDPVILTTILANCATMAWQSPLDPLGTPKAAFIDVCEVRCAAPTGTGAGAGAGAGAAQRAVCLAGRWQAGAREPQRAAHARRARWSAPWPHGGGRWRASW